MCAARRGLSRSAHGSELRGKPMYCNCVHIVYIMHTAILYTYISCIRRIADVMPVCVCINIHTRVYKHTHTHTHTHTHLNRWRPRRSAGNRQKTAIPHTHTHTHTHRPAQPHTAQPTQHILTQTQTQPDTDTDKDTYTHTHTHTQFSKPHADVPPCSQPHPDTTLCRVCVQYI